MNRIFGNILNKKDNTLQCNAVKHYLFLKKLQLNINLIVIDGIFNR